MLLSPVVAERLHGVERRAVLSRQRRHSPALCWQRTAENNHPAGSREENRFIAMAYEQKRDTYTRQDSRATCMSAATAAATATATATATEQQL